jgi:hypothetical protein
VIRNKISQARYLEKYPIAIKSKTKFWPEISVAVIGSAGTGVGTGPLAIAFTAAFMVISWITPRMETGTKT